MLQGQRHQLRDEAERLGINELLVRNASRIDALGEQRDWLQSLQRQQDDLEREAKQYEARFGAEQKRLGEALGLKDGQRLRELTETDLEGLQPQIDALRLAQKRLDAAQRDLDMLTESERSFRTQIETAIVGGESHGLPMDLQEASNLVARLRKRLAVEQRLDQARQHEVELEQQSHDLLDDQVMPLWLFGWLLATFVVGALMLGVWALVPTSPFGKYGGLIALIGVGGAAFAWVFKYFADDAAAEKLDACQRQMEVITKQIADTEREKEAGRRRAADDRRLGRAAAASGRTASGGTGKRAAGRGPAQAGRRRGAECRVPREAGATRSRRGAGDAGGRRSWRWGCRNRSTPACL